MKREKGNLKGIQVARAEAVDGFDTILIKISWPFFFAEVEKLTLRFIQNPKGALKNEKGTLSHSVMIAAGNK